MRLARIAAMLIALFGLGITAPAMAQGFGLAEIRGGLLWHSVDEPGPGGEIFNLTRLEDVNVEALFFSPDIDAFRWLGSPKINVGGNLNIAGRESHAHLGLTWQVPILDTPLFVEGTFGAAVHNGALDLAGTVPPARALGCSLLFYEAAGIGFASPDGWTVLASIEHASSANLCTPNRGLTNLGLKFGMRF